MNFAESEIMAAMDLAGLRFRSMVQISQLRVSQAGRITYRVDHEHGTVKVRLLNDEQTARELVSNRRELGDAFAPVIARYGRLLIEEWIDGTVLPDIPDRVHLEEAGTILAEMHNPSTSSRCASHEVRSTADHRLNAERRLRNIAASGALEQGVVKRLETALQGSDPLQATYGLTHLDFCGENMVIDCAGRLRVVDNEHVRVDAIEYGLGRTWYRWALPARQWDYFCAVYDSRTPLTHLQQPFHFWKITAAVTSAELRIHAFPEKAHVPLECLRRLAAVEVE